MSHGTPTRPRPALYLDYLVPGPSWALRFRTIEGGGKLLNPASNVLHPGKVARRPPPTTEPPRNNPPVHPKLTNAHPGTCPGRTHRRPRRSTARKFQKFMCFRYISARSARADPSPIYVPAATGSRPYHHPEPLGSPSYYITSHIPFPPFNTPEP